MKNRISIGISSIVLIFMILCLAVFSLLSISDAKSALTFAQKRADTVNIYYEADTTAQTWIRDYRKIYEEQKDAERTIKLMSGWMTEECAMTLSENGTVICDFPMHSGQTLHLELEADGTDVLSYYVMNDLDYEIDSDLPVWGGV